MRTLLTILVLLLAPMTARAQAPTPHRSFDELVTTNGYGVGHYSVRDRKVATFFPHLYRQYDEDEPVVRDWLFDAYFGLRRGPSTWFHQIDVDSVQYLPGTGIIEVVQTIPTDTVDVTARQYLFAPFGVDAPVLVMLAELSNEANDPTGGFAAFSLHNFHVGSGEEHRVGEVFERLPGRGWLEKGAAGEEVYLRTISPADGYAVGAGADSPFALMKDGADFEDTSTGELAPRDDAAAGFQFNVPAGLEPGESAWFGVVMGVTDDGAEASLVETVDTWVADRSAEDLLADARSDWEAYQAIGEPHMPDGVSEDERAVWRQSLAMLRMGQVREPNGPGEGDKPNGQLLAALPKAHPAPGEGIWNVSWPRDASYAIAGLSRAGYAEAAQRGLEFMLQADAGEYTDYVGQDYRISVCRYYGRGREESDWNDDGPNIEFDDFGLFLMALGEQLDSPGIEDPDWWKPHWPAIRDEVADVLVALQDETGLIAPDSSIWERHWNGNQKHFTYTSAVAARGLCVAAELAEQMGEAGKAEVYRQTVGELRGAIRDTLVDDQDVVAGNLEELQRGSGYLDLAAVEVFNFGLLDPAGAVASATLDRWRARMYDGAPDGYGGYFRNDDGDWYDSQEWVVVDLRMAVALGYAGQTEQRDRLLEWVTAQTRANFDIMGELYCRGDENCPQRGDYRGSVPMIGFGPGAYIVALTEREKGDAPPEPCAEFAPDGSSGGDTDGGGDAGNRGDVSGPTGSPTSTDRGCQCGTARGPAGAVAVLLVLLLFGRFRFFELRR